jgi:hypothetical protein
MFRTTFICLRTSIALLLCLAVSPAALSQDAPSTQKVDLQKSWNQFAEDVKDLGPWLMSQKGVPRDDPQVQSDAYRYLATLLYVGLDIHLLNANPDQPQWTPTFTHYARYGGDQRDGVYHSAPVDPKGTYRITGRTQGGIPVLATIQTMSGWWTPGMPNKTVKTQSVFDFDLESDGSFELILGGPQRDGNYLPMSADITHLMARQYIVDDSKQRLYQLRIDRIDQPLTVPAESDTPEQLSKKLANAVGFVRKLTTSYLDLSRYASTNRDDLKPMPVKMKAALGASELNNYYIGSWDLGPDEALLIEITPTQAAYWSVAAHNFWFQGLPHSAIPEEINMTEAVPDGDGKIRIIVSHSDPGYVNWISTGGLKIGSLVSRWNLRQGEEQIKTQKVRVADLRSKMPADSLVLSAEERQKQLETIRTRVLTRYRR